MVLTPQLRSIKCNFSNIIDPKRTQIVAIRYGMRYNDNTNRQHADTQAKEVNMAHTKFSIPKLKGLMAERNVTYAELAKILGKTPAAIGSKLSGNRKFTIDELSTLSEHFGISRDDLFTTS